MTKLFHKFHVPKVIFLGYIIGSRRVKADSEKIQAVVEWSRPTTLKQLQQFLGFANFYRRFLKNYSRVEAPLTRLISTSAQFIWTESAFIKLKELFASVPVLIQPDPSLQFIVEVDASDSGVGAVLSQ